MAENEHEHTSTLEDLIADRRNKRQRLAEEFGIDPFGGRVEGLIPLSDARALYDPKVELPNEQRPAAKVAGRIMLHRVMGNLIFMTLRDGSGDLQIAISKKSVDTKSFQLAKLADLGDIAIAAGNVGVTKTGEVTVWTAGEGGFTIATKSLAPPPGKWHGLQDAEQRYRRRYVDLYVNPQVMRTMQLRGRIIEEIRQHLRGRGYLEVETPMLQPLHGGAAARPFETHHNALDMPLYLRIAPEMYLKRLLVGGFSKVFEINRNFRNEGISTRHNPEFTMLEAYEAFGSWETMADMVEEMVCTVAEKVLGTLRIEHMNAEGQVTKTINLTRPWRRVSMVDLVEERTGWKFDKRPLQEAKPEVIGKLLSKRGGDLTVEVGATPVGHIQTLSPAEQLVEVYEKLIESTLIDPTFVTHVPSVVIPLARESREDPFFADVYELAINGVEISPGYSELNDPDVQERHFRHQVGDKEEQQKVDEDFLSALRVGMPPAGGMGLGIDRLVMMLTGAESIRDVILFPLMRPV